MVAVKDIVAQMDAHLEMVMLQLQFQKEQL